MSNDGRSAMAPYRVRVGDIWYWVDPTASGAIEPGDTVVAYPADGSVYLAVLQSRADVDPVAFTTLEGERFEMPRGEIAAMHLAAVDEVQI